MSDPNNLKKTIRSNVELAQMIVRVVQAAPADAIICATETGALVKQVHDLTDQVRIIAATTNGETYTTLTQAGLEVIRLPLRAANKYNQIRHVISVALRSGRISIGDFIACVLGHNLYLEEGDLIVLTEVEPSIGNVAVTDLLKLTDGIRPKVLEAAVLVACKIGRAARRGKRIGAIFMLGDSVKVMNGAKQLIPNPFYGHPEDLRMLTNPNIHGALVELSKLDGAFVVRGDGLIQTAGAFLAPGQVETELTPGLGARHASAAAVTTRTAATAVVVSATDGNVRAFSAGRMVLQIDPDVEYGPITIDK